MELRLARGCLLLLSQTLTWSRCETSRRRGGHLTVVSPGHHQRLASPRSVHTVHKAGVALAEGVRDGSGKANSTFILLILSPVMVSHTPTVLSVLAV